MGKRTFVDIEEVYKKLMGTLVAPEDDLFIPWRALRLAVASATTLVVAEAENTNSDIQN